MRFALLALIVSTPTFAADRVPLEYAPAPVDNPGRKRNHRTKDRAALRENLRHRALREASTTGTSPSLGGPAYFKREAIDST